MKRRTYHVLLALMLSLALPQICFAATKTITINWTMADTTDIVGYKMYYSYSPDMTAKTLACETNDKNVSTLTCQDVTFDQGVAYFTIAAVATTSEEFESSPKEAHLGPSPVLDFKIVVPTP